MELLPRDHPRRDAILHRVKHGAPLITRPLGADVRCEVDNYISATNAQARPYVEAQILQELENDRYEIVQTKPQIISALGAIPKNKQGTKFRIIHDCSRPSGRAVNDFADIDPFQYQSLQDAIDMIRPGDYLAKIDLQNSFRLIGIEVSNYGAMGLKWRFKGQKRDTFMIDKRMAFGARRAPEMFNELSQAVLDIMRTKGFFNIVCYCDDFLLVCSSFEEARRTMLELIKVLRKLGFHINYNKVVGPSQVIVFLGFELNTLTMTVAVPHDKMEDLKSCLWSTITKDKVSKRQLQSLIGKLNWATQVIYGGRFHLRRLLDRIKDLRLPSHRTRVTRDMREDMAWWLNFMQGFNGLTGMVDNRPATPVTIDACPVAAGAHYLGHVVYTPWQTTWPAAQPLHINHKEILALETAAVAWAPLWANKKVFIHCDNTCAVHTINKGRSKNPIVMSSLRRVFWLSAMFNFRLRAVYYPGSCNGIADSVSRLHEPGGLLRLREALAGAALP